MNFEKISIKDIEQIYQLGINVEEFRVDKDIVGFWPKDILKNIIKHAICYKCVIDSQIVGFIITSYCKEFSKATIENIYVKEDFRNKGIGRKLVLKTIEILNKKKCSYLNAYTQDSIEEFLYWGFSKGNEFSWMSLCLDESFKK